MTTPATERFLTAFIDIETHLARLNQAGSYVPFAALVDQVGKHDPAVRYYSDDLKEYADLRNAIVHKRRDGQPIAEPYLVIVEEIEVTRDRLLAPPALLTTFSASVVTCTPRDRVGAAARRMRDGQFSRLPVYDRGTLVDVLTAQTIARWLGGALEQGDGRLVDVPVAEVLEHAQQARDYVLLSRMATVYEALATFEAATRQGESHTAIIVTASGKRNDRPLAILTAFDIPRLLALAGRTAPGSDAADPDGSAG